MNTFFDQLIEQQAAIELLTQVVAQNRIAPAYLFAGVDGIGRTLTANCFIEFLFCQNPDKPVNQKQIHSRIQQKNHPDILWVEPTYLHQGKRLSPKEATEAGVKRKAPPQIRIEQIREISQFLSRPPLEASRLMVVVEHAESMPESAANGLLKTLEEPGKATIILIAPGIDSLLPTLVSRCAKIPFYRLTDAGMIQVLKRHNFDDILSHAEILAMAQGSPGQAIYHWQQLQTIPVEFLNKVKKPPSNLRLALELAKEISQTLDSEAQLWLVDYLQHCDWQDQQKTGIIDQTFLKQLEKTRQYLLSYVQPRLVWECTLMSRF
ncbi:MAG: DNA polymerase III subunit delta' [Planktothrix agardhii]|jgi:DNA polymerase-3 subunit delta'|uniref:DNA polymerase III subunit delta' n=1 Tax=Planktothrix agardhii TaxID=1160 RepID=UPI002432E028|nr:DNA polymerase III subunit delta' [Planktothrix agardhii]MCP9293953.1 DNA polymerase III subunit delta' [Planktothrix agardhii LY1]